MKKTRRKLAQGSFVLGLRVHEVVEVKLLDEIVSTLDENFELEGLPFMHEMSGYCGKKMRVLGRADRITVEGIGVRSIKNVVILEGATCSGQAHEGCQRTCFVLWKEAWLRRSVKEVGMDNSNVLVSPVSPSTFGNTSNCQSASLARAGSELHAWAFQRYAPMIRQRKFQALLTSLKLELFPILTGHHLVRMSTSSRKTPIGVLGLQAGEIVEVKSKDEIVATLDYGGRNRGLNFTKEMEEYCGKRMAVLRRVDKMIIEKTGRMRQIANTVLLDGANCDGQSHGGCPRNCYCLFREIWLRRVCTEPMGQELPQRD